MPARSPTIAQAYAGVFAASSAVVSKYSSRREPALSTIPPAYLPPALHDTPRLLDPRNDALDREVRVARATAAALMYSLEASEKKLFETPASARQPFEIKEGGVVERLLRRDERTRCDNWSVSRTTNVPECHYCTLFHDLLYPNDAPIEIVRHGARIQSEFDPDTNLSEAGIETYQLFVPEELAADALYRSHPLRWQQAAEDLFEFTGPASTQGEKPQRSWVPDPTRRNWIENAIGGNDEYLYEVTKWPWNAEITSIVENVIKISNFIDTSVEDTSARSGKRESLVPASGEKLRSVHKLAFDYSLESCIRSSHGIGWEEYGGLNVDEGRYEASAIAYGAIDASNVEKLTLSDVCHMAYTLERRIAGCDQHEVRAAASARLDTLLDVIADWKRDGNLAPNLRADALRDIGWTLHMLWGEQPWLLTVSARKRLRHTVPMNGPVDLWATLTWMAPAMLFVFINRAVCQLPHFLMMERLESGTRYEPKLLAHSPPLANYQRVTAA